MKRILTVLSFVFALGANGVANAIPMTWTDEYTPAGAPLLFNSSFTTHSWTHDITDEGFDTIADFITDYSIVLDVYDDRDSHYEVATFVQPGRYGSSTFEIDYSDVAIGITFAGLITLNRYGMMDVSLTRQRGDFYFGGSTLIARGFSSDVAGVPEPGTLLLMAAGLLVMGFGWKGARRFQSA